MYSSRIGEMIKNNKFKNGNKQMLKEALAVLGLMVFLAVIAVILAWHKGHLIIQ
jgi:hypothetical protein